MTKTTGNRMGKHRPENVMLGAIVPPRKKAIAIITAAVAAADGSMTLTDLIWRGIENIAISLGVLDHNGNVTEKFRDAVTLAEYQVSANKQTNQERKSRNGN